jgi:hypothetical protein
MEAEERQTAFCSYFCFFEQICRFARLIPHNLTLNPLDKVACFGQAVRLAEGSLFGSATGKEAELYGRHIVSGDLVEGAFPDSFLGDICNSAYRLVVSNICQ